MNTELLVYLGRVVLGILFFTASYHPNLDIYEPPFSFWTRPFFFLVAVLIAGQAGGLLAAIYLISLFSSAIVYVQSVYSDEKLTVLLPASLLLISAIYLVATNISF